MATPASTALGPQPVWLAELASSDAGGDKPAWVRDMFASTAFPRIAALIWFDQDKEADWRVTSDADVLRAFQDGLGVSPITAAADALRGLRRRGTDGRAARRARPSPGLAILLMAAPARRARCGSATRPTVRDRALALGLDTDHWRCPRSGLRRPGGRHRVTLVRTRAAGVREAPFSTSATASPAWPASRACSTSRSSRRRRPRPRGAPDRPSRPSPRSAPAT